MHLVENAVTIAFFLLVVSLLFSYISNTVILYHSKEKYSRLKETSISFLEYFTLGKYNLTSTLYRIRVIIKDPTGTGYNGNVNFTLNFDRMCKKNITENSIRVYTTSYEEVEYSLYNKTYCDGTCLKSAEMVIPVKLQPNENKTFYVYFSSESTNETGYSVEYPITEPSLDVILLPRETLTMISSSRMYEMNQTLRNSIPKGIFTEIYISP